MSSAGKTIVRNATALMTSQIITWGFAIVLTIFLSRYLGASGIGKIHLANSIWAIMVIFASFGMDTLLTKEIARNPDKLNELFGTGIVIRVILYLIGIVLVGLYTYSADYPADTVSIIAIIGVASFFAMIGMASSAALRGIERMEFISISNVVSKLFLTVMTIAMIVLQLDIMVIATVSVGSTAIYMFIQLYYLRRIYPLQFKVHLDKVGWMMGSSIPYLVTTLFRTIYVQIDIIVISLLVNESVIGWYSAADRLFATFLFVPSILMTAVFPALSRMHHNKSAQLYPLMRKSFNLLLLVSIPLGFGLVVVSNSLVVLLYGEEFANSGPILAMFGIVLILTYQNTMLGKFLVSTDRQKPWTIVVIIATLATIPLDLILVPWFHSNFGNGALGGTTAFIITELIMMSGALYLLPRGALGKENFWMAVRTIFAGLLMLSVTWWFRNMFIIVPVVIGAAVYIGLVFLFHLIPQEDWQTIKTFGKSTYKRVQNRVMNPS